MMSCLHRFSRTLAATFFGLLLVTFLIARVVPIDPVIVLGSAKMRLVPMLM